MNQFLTTESKKILQPENISIDLMEHQKTTVHAMLQLEKDGYIDADQLLFYFNTPKDFRIKTTMGILGDIVGAGKSLMIISLISISQTPINRDVVVDSSPNIFVELLDVYDKPKTNLLIVPDNLLIQWNDFFKLSNLNLITYNSTTTLDEILLFDVILIGANNVEGFNAKFPMIKWARIIIDEADSIKLPKKIDFNCRFLWLVTGTPTGLRHSLRSYLTAKIMGNMKGWIFDYITIKNDPEFVKLSLQLQPPKKIKIQCITPNEIHILKDIIPKNTISMINAGNLNEAIKSLNCNCDTTDNILQVVTKNIQIAIKNKTLELETEKKKVYKGELVEQNQQKKIKHIEHILQRLSSRYDSIKKNIMTMNDEYCPICMDEFTKPTIVSCCQTIFCFQCIVLCAGTTKKCPHCMKLIKKENMNVIKKKRFRRRYYI